ncbi:MAG: hypothetical protein HY909_16555 [Deltaproteobacteria bacterium]|nr:hypothetical protein [Deltaproteobacteria bacterium]
MRIPNEVLIALVMVPLVGVFIAVLLRGSPGSRRWSDPDLSERAEGYARVLVDRGWKLLVPEEGALPTIRRLEKGDVTLRVGCTPSGDWCAATVLKEVGLPAGVRVQPPAGTRDPEDAARPQLRRPDGGGWVVLPKEAREQLPEALVRALLTWPAGDVVSLRDGVVEVRRDLRAVDDVDALLADIDARFGPVTAS